MPTAYTEVLYSGPQTFEQYALRCARAFGAYNQFRDESLDAELPATIEPDDRHSKRLTECYQRFFELSAMTEQEKLIAAQGAYGDWMCEDEEARLERKERKQRYDLMLKKVRAWQPPTEDHARFKAFMLEQLEISMSDATYYSSPAPSYDGQTWWLGEIDQVRRDIAYHIREQASDNENAKKRNAWLQALRGAL